MSSTSFPAISAQFGIYFGLPLCVSGIIGNLINLRVLYSTRSNPSTFLLWISSFFNIIALSEGLFPRILVISFNIDPSSTSIIWCKIRFFITYSAPLCSTICLCFASIDRFFVSCRSVAWRNRSKLSTAKIAILIATLVIFGSNVPFLFTYTMINVKSSTGNTTTVCSLIDPAHGIYISYVFRPVFLSLLPGMIMGITGWLTYRNINLIAGTQVRGTLQRSLTSMILLQIVTAITPIIPFATVNIYQVVASSMIKSSYRLAEEALVYNIANIFIYSYCALNFYVYLISASSYRRDFLKLVLFCDNRNHENNRVGTMTREQFEMKTIPATTHLSRSVKQTEQRIVT